MGEVVFKTVETLRKEWDPTSTLGVNVYGVPELRPLGRERFKAIMGEKGWDAQFNASRGQRDDVDYWRITPLPKAEIIDRM